MNLCRFQENSKNFQYSRSRAVASGGASGARPPHFTFGPLVSAYIQYSIIKMWPPLLLHRGDGPDSKKDFLISKIWKLILLFSLTLFLSMLKRCHKNIKWNWVTAQQCFQS